MPSDYRDRNGNIIDYYAIFNVPATADTDSIRSSFCALIKRYHPDLGGSSSEQAVDKIDLIIRGYRILADEETRRDYDRELFASRTRSPEGTRIVSRKRVRYSASLTGMLESRFMPRGMKRKDILKNFGQDVEIILTRLEATAGAVAYVTLPTRSTCPYCMGSDPACHVCRGVGRIATTSQLEVRIPPHVDDSTIIDVDLLNLRPDKLTAYTMATLRIKISIPEAS